MLGVDKLSIETLKGRKLIENLSFNLNNGDKMAIIGEEGNGKSTLMKAIIDVFLINSYCTVTGKIIKNNCRIGYLEQRISQDWDTHTVLDFFLHQNAEDEPDYSKYNELKIYENILRQLKFNASYLYNDMLIKNLSGGEKVKLQIAKLMSDNFDAIFLDEPTNDLDIDTLEILEKFIIDTRVPVLYISHDETLLERTANIILHIEQLIKKTKPKYNLSKCTYSEYIRARQKSIEHQTQIAFSERREKSKKEEVLRQIKQKVENALNSAKKDPSSGRIIAKKMANIKAQEKRNENEELTEIPDVEEAINIIADQTISLPNQKRVLDINFDKLIIGDKILSSNVSLKVFGAERIAIIGSNGCGKTTFIKKIVPILKNTIGLNIGYFSQNYYEILDYTKTPIEELSEVNTALNPRTLLGALKFTREEMTHRIEDLSEGQKAKIALLKIIIEKNNVLVLDEPTRNLSPLSNPIIRQMLNSYHGAIITVSHDRKFISEVCDKIYLLNKNGLSIVNDFNNYSAIIKE